MNVLVVAAHPDDEVLGCGGTIARLAAGGDDVAVLVLGEGAASRADDASASAREIDRLHDVAQRAGALLGASSVRTTRFPDNRFDAVDLLDIVKVIEAEIERHRPEVVYCQHGGDVNVDHQLVYRATLAATRPQPGHPTREVLSFEVASSTEWAFGTLDPPFVPNVFNDISAHLDAKVAALELYESEMRPFPHARSIDAVRAIARRWGAAVGIDAAEAFHLVRSTR